MLIILSGLPAVGKTSLARALAVPLHAVHLRIDSIEQSLLATGLLKDSVAHAGYAVAYAVAEDNLRSGLTVIADAVNALPIVRDAWFAVAERCGVRTLAVEVVCSNAREHEQRARTRRADIPGLQLPTWREIVERRFEPWDRPVLSLDTSLHSLESQVSQVLARFA